MVALASTWSFGIIRFATLGTLNIDRVVMATDLWDYNYAWGVKGHSPYGPWTSVYRSQRRTYKIKRNLCLVHSTWHALVLPYLFECIAIIHSGTLPSVLALSYQKPERRRWAKRVEWRRREGYPSDDVGYGWTHAAASLEQLLVLCPHRRIIHQMFGIKSSSHTPTYANWLTPKLLDQASSSSSTSVQTLRNRCMSMGAVQYRTSMQVSLQSNSLI